MKKIFFVGLLALFTLGACNNHSAHDGHNHETHSEEEHSQEGHSEEEHDHSECGGHHEEEETATPEGHGDEIILPKAKADAAGVTVETIQPQSFQAAIRCAGQVLAAQGNETTVVATTSGIVSFHGKVTEGMNVSRGKSLFLLSAKGLQEGDPVQRAKLNYETTRQEYLRQKALVAQKIVSEKDFAITRQAYENARIGYEALSKGHSVGGQSVGSPMNGFVKNILVKEGDYVQMGQALAVITQNQHLQLRAEVSEKYYSALKDIRSANFQTPYNTQVYELNQLNGRLLSYGKASAESSFYIPVTFEFDNKGEVIPGSFVEVYLLSAPTEGVLALPKTALTEEQGIFFIYKQLDEEGYQKQEVTTGADNGRSVQILSGLKAGDRVVTKGAFHVKLASASAAIPAHSHEH